MGWMMGTMDGMGVPRWDVRTVGWMGGLWVGRGDHGWDGETVGGMEGPRGDGGTQRGCGNGG